MNLYLLRARTDLPRIENPAVNPWEPWYDKAFGFVVAARDERDARLVIHEADGGTESDTQPGDEGSGAWTDDRFSTCVCIGTTTTDVPRGVILRDFMSA